MELLGPKFGQVLMVLPTLRLRAPRTLRIVRGHPRSLMRAQAGTALLDGCIKAQKYSGGIGRRQSSLVDDLASLVWRLDSQCNLYSVHSNSPCGVRRLDN